MYIHSSNDWFKSFRVFVVVIEFLTNISFLFNAILNAWWIYFLKVISAVNMLIHAIIFCSFLEHQLSLILGLFGMMMQEDIFANSLHTLDSN